MPLSRTVSADVTRILIARIVACVRQGDDAAVNTLVGAFARHADLHDLFALRTALNGASPPGR